MTARSDTWTRARTTKRSEVGAPEEDKSDKYLGEDLAAAAAKVPAGVLSAANLKAMFKEAMAEGQPHLAEREERDLPVPPAGAYGFGFIIIIISMFIIIIIMRCPIYPQSSIVISAARSRDLRVEDLWNNAS